MQLSRNPVLLDFAQQSDATVHMAAKAKLFRSSTDKTNPDVGLWSFIGQNMGTCGAEI